MTELRYKSIIFEAAPLLETDCMYVNTHN